MKIDNKCIDGWVKSIDGKKSDPFYKSVVGLTILDFVMKYESEFEDIVIDGDVFYEAFNDITTNMLLPKEYGFTKELWMNSPNGKGKTIMGKIIDKDTKAKSISKVILKMPVYKLNSRDEDKSKICPTGDFKYKGDLYTLQSTGGVWSVVIARKDIKTLKAIYEPLRGYLLYNWAKNISKYGVADLEMVLTVFEKKFNNFTRDVTYMKWCKDVLMELDSSCFYMSNIDTVKENKFLQNKIKKYSKHYSDNNASLDHYKPVAERGKDNIKNYILTSRELNSSKGKLIWTDFDKKVNQRNKLLKQEIDNLIKKCKVPMLHANQMRKDLGVR